MPLVITSESGSFSNDELLLLSTRACLRVFPCILSGVCTGDHPRAILTAIRTLVITDSEAHSPGLVDTKLISSCIRDAAQMPPHFGNNTAAHLACLALSECLDIIQSRDEPSSIVTDLYQHCVSQTARAGARLATDQKAHRELRDTLRVACAEDEHLLSQVGLEALGRQGLWLNSPLPDRIKKSWRSFSSTSYSQDKTWRFWRDWYVGHLEDKPMARAVLDRIARIDDHYWYKGTDEIAFQIRELQSRIALTEELEIWERKTKEALIPGQGHNKAPGDVGLIEVDQVAKEVEEQLQLETAEISTLQKLLRKLVALQDQIQQLLAEGARKAAVKAVGGAIAAGSAYAYAQSEQILLKLNDWINALLSLPI